MENFNWNAFKNVNSKIVVNCKTEEEVNNFLNKCQKEELEVDGILYSILFQRYGTDTCYRCDTCEVLSGHKEIYKKYGYTILDWRNYMQNKFDESLEKVKEVMNKYAIEKTFQKVIADDVKEDEVWENNIFKISKVKGNINIWRKDGEEHNGFAFANDMKFKLQIKEYDFIEVLKAYEKGKEIESLETGMRYKKIDDKDCEYVSVNDEWVSCFILHFNEINGKWYIND